MHPNLPPKPIVYIGGPIAHGPGLQKITHDDLMMNIHKASMAWYQLHDSGLVVPLCPHWSIFQGFLTPIPREEWLEHDYYFVLKSDAFLRLPGTSDGADKESRLANDNNIPLFWSSWEDDTLIWTNLRRWADDWIADREQNPRRNP